MKSLTVFCGSRPGNNPLYMAQAHELGRLLNQKGISLVFGGGNHGLMGAVCDGILEGDAPGGVVAVIPKFMIEQVHVKVGKVDVVQTMHERKAMMAKEGDGFVALPGTGFPPQSNWMNCTLQLSKFWVFLLGGIGTLEEITEMITWSALGLHSKPVAVLNTAGFYDHLLGHWKKMHDEGFVAEDVYGRLIVASTPTELLEKMLAYHHR